MSALGQNRTLEREAGMSALASRADMLSLSMDVRKVPRTDTRNTPFSPFPIIL